MKKSVIGLIILLILGLSITAILTSISVLAKEDGKEHNCSNDPIFTANL
jgi:uncharacterized alpha/beta hydrolase family protein